MSMSVYKYKGTRTTSYRASTGLHGVSGSSVADQQTGVKKVRAPDCRLKLKLSQPSSLFRPKATRDSKPKPIQNL